MLYRPTIPPFPRERMSPGAIATVAAIHVGLLWLLLQYSPLVPTVRYVVYQYVRPISPPPASRAITVRPKPAASPNEAPSVFSNTPESSVPMQATTQLPESLQPKQKLPVPRAAEPKPLPKRRTDVAPERAREPVQAPPPRPLPVPPPPEPEVPPPPELPPAPQPAPAPPPAEPVPVPAPAPAPAPQAMPVPEPAPFPVPEPAPVPVPAPAPAPVEPPIAAPPAPAPVPAPAPTESPEPAPAPAPAPTPATAVPAPAPTQRLQGPVIDVPVAPGSPGAGAATPVPVPLPPGGGWGAPVPPPVPAARALPPPPMLAPALPPEPGPYRAAPRRSLSELANAQLRRDKKEPLAAEVEDAAVDDCVHASEKPSAVSGLLNAPVVAARALTGRCAK